MNKIGRLTVIEDLGRKPYPKETSPKRRIYRVECDCGTIKEMRADVYKQGKTLSCGCSQYTLEKLCDIGDIFGRLTVIRDLGRISMEGASTVARYYECLCSCGNITTVQWSNLKFSNVQSCGCLLDETRKDSAKTMQEMNIVHGDSSKDSEFFYIYSLWCRMRARCYNPNHDKYKWYGGSGIVVCKEWNDSYQTFKEWALLNGYEKGLSIDRTDVLGNYEPSNCSFMTMNENRNKRDTVDKQRKLDYQNSKKIS